MDRRDFISTAGTLMLTGAAIELRAASQSFDPTEQSIASLQRALSSGALTSEALTEAYLWRIARFDQHGPEHRSVLALNPNASRRRAHSMRSGRPRKCAGRCMAFPSW